MMSAKNLLKSITNTSARKMVDAEIEKDHITSFVQKFALSGQLLFCPRKINLVTISLYATIGAFQFSRNLAVTLAFLLLSTAIMVRDKRI
jgi:hypothetical protein